MTSPLDVLVLSPQNLVSQSKKRLKVTASNGKRIEAVDTTGNHCADYSEFFAFCKLQVDALLGGCRTSWG